MSYSDTFRTKKKDIAKVPPATTSASGVPSLFASSDMSNTSSPYRKSTVKTTKIGTERVIPKKTSNGDINIGNKLIANTDAYALKKASSRESNSYLNKRGGRFKGTGRPKVNIFALIDDAIEDGATSEAKQKASIERAAATAPVPAHKKSFQKTKQSIAAKKQTSILEPSAKPQLKDQESKSLDKKVNRNQVHESKKEKKKLVNNENADQQLKFSSVPVASQVRDSPQSKPSAKAAPKLVSNSSSSATPAWKARIKKQGRKLSDPVSAEQKSKVETEKNRTRRQPSPNTQQKPWQTRLKAQGKKIPEQTLPLDNTKNCELTLSHNQQIEAPPTLGTGELTKTCIAPNITDTKGKGNSTADLMGSTKEKRIEALVNIPIPPKGDRSITDTKGKGNSTAQLKELTKEKKTETPIQISIAPKSDRSVTDTTRKILSTAGLMGSVKEKKTEVPVKSKTKRDSVGPSSKFSSPRSVAKPNNDDDCDDDNENNNSIYESVSEPFESPFRKKPVTLNLSKADGERNDIVIDNDDEILEKTRRPSGSEGRDATIAAPPVDTVLVRLRKNLEETQKKLDSVAMVSKQELTELEKEFTNTKETLRSRLMKDIHAQKKKNEKQHEEYQKVVDKKQQEIRELQSANQRLRVTIEMRPKQMAEVKASNQSLEKSNEEIAGHIENLRKFSEKLQTDQDRLLESSDNCKNEFLPRHRQELWERQQYLDTEIKTKNIYRDCIIKITKKIEKSKQIRLIEEVSALVLETEGENNPNFDPNFLSAYDSDDSSSSSDDSDSDSSDSDDSD